MSPPAAAGAVLLDTGVLVALQVRRDPFHASARQWLAGFQGQLHTVEAVLTETAFFVPSAARAGLAELAAYGTLQVHAPDAAGYQRMAGLMRKFVDQDPDWADVALIWLAEQLGTPRIATLDVADFSVYRINGRRRFELELLR